MDSPIRHYWEKRLESLRKNLERNNFIAFVADSADEARSIVMVDILPTIGGKRISWGGSQTFAMTMLYDALKKDGELTIHDTYERNLSPEELSERQRQSLLADVFITSANAVTESGVLVNLDMLGNRVAALAFGPRHVIVLAGRNKIVSDIDEAMFRIRNYAAPVNAARYGSSAPCVRTSYCDDEACTGDDRLCNVWSITEKSCPRGRINVVLINEDIGF